MKTASLASSKIFAHGGKSVALPFQILWSKVFHATDRQKYTVEAYHQILLGAPLNGCCFFEALADFPQRLLETRLEKRLSLFNRSSRNRFKDSLRVPLNAFQIALRPLGILSFKLLEPLLEVVCPKKTKLQVFYELLDICPRLDGRRPQCSRVSLKSRRVVATHLHNRHERRDDRQNAADQGLIFVYRTNKAIALLGHEDRNETDPKNYADKAETDYLEVRKIFFHKSPQLNLHPLRRLA